MLGRYVPLFAPRRDRQLNVRQLLGGDAAAAQPPSAANSAARVRVSEADSPAKSYSPFISPAPALHSSLLAPRSWPLTPRSWPLTPLRRWLLLLAVDSSLLLLVMVALTGRYFERPEQLFHEHHARQLMRQRHRRQRKSLVTTRLDLWRQT